MFLSSRMNNTTLGNTSLLFFSDNNVMMVSSICSMIFRLPVNIYVLQLIVSRHWIVSELSAFKESALEIAICLYDILKIASYISPNSHLQKVKVFFEVFLSVGYPCFLTLSGVECYLAVVKPLFFFKLKPLKYKLAPTWIVGLWTLSCCTVSFFIDKIITYEFAVLQTAVCSLLHLYVSIATLRALKRPGPGEAVRPKEGMSNIKLRAFRMMLFITVSYFIFFVPITVLNLLRYISNISFQTFLMLVHICYCFAAFGSLVKSLIFLQRTGNLTCMRAYSKWQSCLIFEAASLSHFWKHITLLVIFTNH